MLERIFKILTSLRLTVICLAFGIIVVFVGTIAQADEGLYEAQARYFKQWLVWPITMFGNEIPLPLPGGYLIGTVLVVNLILAHIKRFQFTMKKLGIHLTHVGLIMLLLGQLATDLFSRETQLHFKEGQSKDFSESGRDYEFALITDGGAESNIVTSIPLSLLSNNESLQVPGLPLTIRFKEYWPNSDLNFRAPMASNAPPLAPMGVAQAFDFFNRDVTHTMDEKNVPTAVVELSSENKPLGTWVASGWTGDETLVRAVWLSFARQVGEGTANRIRNQLTAPQSITLGDTAYEFIIRPTRKYENFSLTLLKATHENYPGTDIPKNFASRVRIENPVTRENREVDIYMNNPLRYEGLTFYQYQMGRDELNASLGTSTLQVVRNPSWLAPYGGCILVGLGLLYQFMYHLVGFIKKRQLA